MGILTEVTEVIRALPPAGREQELALLEEFLARRAPGRIVISGDDGMGKSHLLRAFGRRVAAGRPQWRVVVVDQAGELAEEGQGTPGAFERLLRERLGLSSPDGMVRSMVEADDSGGGTQPGAELTSPPAGSVKKGIQPFEAYAQKAQTAEERDDGDKVRTMAPMWEATRHSPGGKLRKTRSFAELSALVADLAHYARRQPLLVMLDCFRPEQALIDWLRETFLRDVKRSGAALVVVVAGLPADMHLLKGAADRFITLDLIEPETLRRYLRDLATSLDLSLDEEELDCYCRTAREPRFVGSLARLFALLSEAEKKGG